MNLEKLTAERLTASIRDSVTSVGGKIEAITMSSKGGVVNEGAVPEKEEKKEKTGVVRLVRRSDRRDERTRRLQHEVVALDRAEAEADKYVELFAGFRRKCEELSAAAMERRKANEDHSGDKSRMKGGATFEANANSGSDSRLGAENQDYIYEDGYFVMEVYFAIFHSHSIAGLKAFDSVHTNYSVTDSSKRSLLTIALLVFSVEGDERLWEILRFLAYRQSTDAAVRALKKTLIFLDIDPESLIELCQQIVSGSSFPIITSLHMAAFLKKCARQFPAYGDDFRKGETKFTETAIALFSSIHSAHVAALVLEEEDETGSSVLNVAIATENRQFLGSTSITKFVNAMWQKVDFMQLKKIQNAAPPLKEHLINLVQTPHSFFLYPFGKFLIESISFLLHLMLISYVAVYKIGDFNQGATLSRLEVLAWLSCLSFTLREGEEIYADGLAAYLKYGRNILDLTLHSMVVVLFSLRFCGLVLFDLDYGLVFLFDLLFTLYIIGLWARLSIIMLAHPRAGPLIRAIFQMGTDIRNFLYIASLFLAGFSIAFYYLVNVSAESLGVTIQGFETIPDTVLRMFEFFMGGVAFAFLDDLPYSYRRYGQILVFTFTIVAALILVNLLIAMMADTYSTVQEIAHLEYAFTRAEFVYRMDRAPNDLPPPFNLPLLACYSFAALPAALAHACGNAEDASVAPVTGSAPDALVYEGDGNGSANDHDHASDKGGKDGGHGGVMRVAPNFPREVGDAGNADAHADKAEARGASWTCGICQADNHTQSADSMQLFLEDFLRKKQDLEADDVVEDFNKLHVSIVACTKCVRIKRIAALQSRSILLKENIGYIIFLVFLWLPLALVLLLLSLFDFVRAKFDYSMDSAHSKSGGNDDKHDNDTDNVDDNNHDNADDTGLGTNIGGSSNHSFYAAGTNAHINGKEAAVSSFKDPVMASWVQEHSYVPPKSLEDVAEMMHHLAEDLAQERRLRKQAEQRAARKDMELRQMLRHLINTTTSVNKSIKKLNGEQAPEEAASSSWEASAPASAALQAHRENSRQRSSSKEHSDYVSPYSKQMYSGISGRRHRSQRGSRVRVKVRGKKLGRTGGMASFRQQMGLSGALPKKETVYDRLHRNGRR